MVDNQLESVCRHDKGNISYIKNTIQVMAKFNNSKNQRKEDKIPSNKSPYFSAGLGQLCVWPGRGGLYSPRKGTPPPPPPPARETIFIGIIPISSSGLFLRKKNPDGANY